MKSVSLDEQVADCWLAGYPDIEILHIIELGYGSRVACKAGELLDTLQQCYELALSRKGVRIWN